MYINSEGQIYGGSSCPNFILIPNNICINECDLNIYHTTDNYQCGYCLHITLITHHKLLNTPGCLIEKPYGTY